MKTESTKCDECHRPIIGRVFEARLNDQCTLDLCGGCLSKAVDELRFERHDGLASISIRRMGWQHSRAA